MTTQPDIAGPLAALEDVVASLDVTDLPAVLGNLEALKAAILLRLVQPPPPSPAPAPPPEHGALTQEDVADRYGMPLRTVRRLTRTGILPSVLVGRNRMLRTADVDTYLARCRAQHVRVGTRLDA